jgi:hypothetical protein
MSFQISLLVTSWQSHPTGLYNKILNYRMMDFLAQNKRRSNVHKENNTKIENIEKIKFSLAALCYTRPSKKNWSTTQLVCPIILDLLQI